ncbi:MAG: hypothetical protein ABIG61_00905 [Planctomycetota bacterium]
MSNAFGSLCDDFSVEMYINTELDLPTDRDMVLSFFERIQKQFPPMGNFFRRDNGELCLEEDRDSGKYRWVSLEIDRLGSGCADPENLADAYELDRLVIELMPYMLGVSHLDVDSLDVGFVLDFDYRGNHDEVIADALFAGSAFVALLDLPNSKAVGYSPTVLVSLSDDCRLQARISVESKTSAYEIRREDYKAEDAITLYFTIRQYPAPGQKFDVLASFQNQCRIAEELMAEKIFPAFVKPLASAIAQRR